MVTVNPEPLSPLIVGPAGVLSSVAVPAVPSPAEFDGVTVIVLVTFVGNVNTAELFETPLSVVGVILYL